MYRFVFSALLLFLVLRAGHLLALFFRRLTPSSGVSTLNTTEHTLSITSINALSTPNEIYPFYLARSPLLAVCARHPLALLIWQTPHPTKVNTRVTHK